QRKLARPEVSSWKARVRSRCSRRSSSDSSKPMTIVAVVFRPAATRARWASKYSATVYLNLLWRARKDSARISEPPQAILIALTNGGEELAVVVERKMGVEAAVEAGQVAAERKQLIQFGEDLVAAEDVAAGLAREAVEGAVIALGDTDVGVVDDPHNEVGALIGRMEAGARGRSKLLQLGVGGVAPEAESVVSRKPGHPVLFYWTGDTSQWRRSGRSGTRRGRS